MKFAIDHDLHIHSKLSSCSRDPGQTTEAILRYAEENGLKKICITDHYWDERVPGVSSWYAPQNTTHIRESLPLPKSDKVEFLFGCETEFNRHFTVGVSKERFDELDFVIIPTTHMHMDEFVLPEGFEDTCANRAKLWIERFDALLSQDLPFRKIGIAHPTCFLIDRRSEEDFVKTLSLIPDEEIERIFTKTAALGCGIELNKTVMCYEHGGRDANLRFYKIAKDCGTKFYLGTDAHHPDNFCGMRETFEPVIEELGLTEDDKFIIKATK